MTPTSTDMVFGALADPNRRAIVERIAGDGPATATSLASELSISRQGAAKHLAGLAEAGILEARRSGREVRFGLVEGGLEPGAAWMARVGDRWDERLEDLRRHVRD